MTPLLRVSATLGTVDVSGTPMCLQIRHLGGNRTRLVLGIMAEDPRTFTYRDPIGKLHGVGTQSDNQARETALHRWNCHTWSQ